MTNNALAPGAAAEIATAPIDAEPPIAPVIPPSESDPAGAVRTSRVVSGGLWGVGGQTVQMAASIIATPFLIRLLGADRMGVIGLVDTLNSYGVAADVGMGPASTKFGADAFGRGDQSSESAVVWTALLVSLIPTAAFAILMMLAAGPLVDHILRVQGTLRTESVLALRLGALVLCMRAIAGVLNTPQTVRLRLDLVSIITYGGATLQILSVPFALWLLHGGLGTAMGVTVGVGVAIAIAQAIVAQRMLPALRRPRFASDLVPTLMRYGRSSFVLVVVTLVLFNSEKFLVSYFGSAEVLGYYIVSFRLSRMLAVLPGALSPPLLPAFARLHATGDHRGAQVLYDRSLRWLLLVNVPLSVLFVFLARPLLMRWAGPSFAEHGAIALAVLSVGSIANGIAYVPILLLQSLARIDLMARYLTMLIVPYLAATAVMTHLWGPDGAAWAWTARACAECGLLLLACRKAGGVTPSHLRSLTPILAPTLAMSLVLAVIPSSITIVFAGLLVAGALAMIVYVLLTWAVVLTRDERAWLVHHGGMLVSRVTGAPA